MHIHIVAVSGTGMGALAGLLKELGHQVSGSDVAFDPRWDQPSRVGGYAACKASMPGTSSPAPDLTVIGNVCRKDNPEVQAALRRGLRYTHIAGALAEFALDGCSPLVVAGTHARPPPAPWRRICWMPADLPRDF